MLSVIGMGTLSLAETYRGPAVARLPVDRVAAAAQDMRRESVPGVDQARYGAFLQAMHGTLAIARDGAATAAERRVLDLYGDAMRTDLDVLSAWGAAASQHEQALRWQDQADDDVVYVDEVTSLLAELVRRYDVPIGRRGERQAVSLRELVCAIWNVADQQYAAAESARQQK